jgi:hypothetical protein
MNKVAKRLSGCLRGCAAGVHEGHDECKAGFVSCVDDCDGPYGPAGDALLAPSSSLLD